MKPYLEISGRQVGKTTRLLENAVSWLESDPDHTVMIMVPTSGMARDHREKMIDFKYRCTVATTLFQAGVAGDAYNPLCDPTVKWYWDEFDTVKFDPARLSLVDNGYYVTTPRKYRSPADLVDWNRDALLQVLTFCQFKHVSVSGLSRFANPNYTNLDVEAAAEYIERVGIANFTLDAGCYGL